jgi:hypothetical protein
MAYDWQNHNRQVVLQGRQILEQTSSSLARTNQVNLEEKKFLNKTKTSNFQCCES